LLARYVDAFERFDMEALVKLLHDDAIFAMPPFAFWLRGVRAIHEWMLTIPPTNPHLVSIEANGSPAFAVYKPENSGRLEAFAIQVLECADSRIAAVHTYLDPSLFAGFDLPLTWPKSD
jgi:RNA polymerase sigma-70 factor (ECF subfamily)